MTGSEFYTYVLSVFKRTDKSTEAYEAMTDAVMDIYLRILPEAGKAEVSVTGINTVGAFSDDLYDSGETPNGVGYVIGDVIAKDTSSDDAYFPLTKISKPEYDRMFYSRVHTDTGKRLTGIPSHFCIFDKKLYVGPPVDKTTYTFQLNVSNYEFTDIVSGTASVPFTPEYRWILRAGVLEKLYEVVEAYEQSAYWGSKFREGVALIENQDMTNTAALETVAFRGV